MDKSSDALYQTSSRKPEDYPNVVHLTHLTTTESIYHLRLGSANLSSRPQNTLSVWYMWIMWPFTFSITLLTWLCGRAIVSERNTFKKLMTQTWVLPKYTLQYHLKWQATAINKSIEKAIREADTNGAKVLSLGLLNQEKELNAAGELYIEKHSKLKLKLVDGSSLAAAVVLNSIPQGTLHVLLVGKLNKVSGAVASTLFHRDVKIWLVGDGLSAKEQLNAPKGTLFIPFNQIPPKRVRKDCFYGTTPAMLAPKSPQNLDSCEDWLPRKVLSASRIAGIIHALEEWDIHECGPHNIFSIDKV